MSSFEVVHHAFTPIILEILTRRFGEDAHNILAASPLLGYLNQKTKAAYKGSKARASFANHYALYVIIEDYIKQGFAYGQVDYPYSQYSGARFSDLLRRQRELPFGAKLQNHALNARLNEEFKKFYPRVPQVPIVRDVENQRYWIQEDLLHVELRQKDGKDYRYNLAEAVIEIIDTYIAQKKVSFDKFLETCRQIAALEANNYHQAVEFITQQLNPQVDARIFEIISYAILKAKYGEQTIWIGDFKDTVIPQPLMLYKTGRTNANDGGIDFMMKPLGRFFQVTETIDVNKYFLDIDKVQRFPLTFVVKSTASPQQIYESIRNQATAKYKIEAIVNAYMEAIEEIININNLIDIFNAVLNLGKLSDIMAEIILQSQIEFNYNEINLSA